MGSARLGVAQREADKRGARVVAPVRREETAEGGHEVDALGAVGHGGGEGGDLGRARDHAEAIPEPVDAWGGVGVGVG